MNIPTEIWVPEYAVKTKHKELKYLPVKGTQGWLCSMKSVRTIAKKTQNGFGSNYSPFGRTGEFAGLRTARLVAVKKPDLIVTIHGTELLRFWRKPIGKNSFQATIEKDSEDSRLSSFNKIALLRLVPELEDRVLLFLGAPARRSMGKGQKKPKSKEENQDPVRRADSSKKGPRPNVGCHL